MNGICFLVFTLVLISDQVSKYYVRYHFELGETLVVVPKVFNFTYVMNPGAAFGLFGDLPDPLRRYVLFGVTFLALIAVFYFMLKEAKSDRWALLALSGILAGALGNIIDRVRFDAVVDFLDVYWGEAHWPAFNIADSAISVGVAVLIFRLVLFKPPETEGSNSPAETSSSS